MKITAIRAENYQRIREIAVELPHAVSLFVGDNDQGKSSLQDAIRLAFTGEAVRVRLKKHWPAMVRQGAKASSIVVEWRAKPDATGDYVMGRATVNLPSGKVECHPDTHPALGYVLDAPRFASLEPDQRRRFLFELIGIKLDVSSVKERLMKRGCRADLVEAISPILRSGFESAHGHAMEKQKEYRSAWANITGETYGEKKGETWRAPLTGTEVDRAQLTTIQEAITTISLEIKEITKNVGAAEAYLSNKARYDRDSKALKDVAALLSVRKKKLTSAERSVGDQRPIVSKAEADLQNARLNGQPCPSCGTIIAMQGGGKLVEVPAVGKERVAALEAALSQANSTMRLLSEGYTNAESEYQASLRASATMAELEQAMASPTTPDTLQKLKQQAAELEHDVEQLTEQQTDISNKLREVDRAKRTTDDAKKAHQLVVAWGGLADALAPDGIPGDLLKEALGPINARLLRSSKATDWARVELGGDMDILVGRVPYGLCGESVRWRADAMIAEAISNAAGVRMLVLDRFDVLAPERRGALLDWCFDLAEKDGYESILLFGTLKKKPELEGANVFWLEDGKL